MSLYAGLSLLEIYERKCAELRCRPNSKLRKLLTRMPEEYDDIRVLDLTDNFVGCIGIRPVFEVIRWCFGLRELHLVDQHLTQPNVEELCAILRRHPCINTINLQGNTISVAAGLALLELVKANPNIKTVLVSDSQTRPSTRNALNAQVQRNRSDDFITADLIPPRSSCPGVGDAASAALLPQQLATGEDSETDPIGLKKSASPRMHSAGHSTADRSHTWFARCPLKQDLIVNTLESFPHSLHPLLYDVDPVDALTSLCNTYNAAFIDPQFTEDSLARTQTPAGHEIESWRRILDLSPSATLFPEQGGGKAEAAIEGLQMPEKCPAGTAWVFTCVYAVARVNQSLHVEDLIHPATLSPVSVYSVRLFIDGKWRYIVVDDYLPVTSSGELVFTKAQGANCYFWPCLLEKALAKLNGGYSSICRMSQVALRLGAESAAVFLPALPKPSSSPQGSPLRVENHRRSSGNTAGPTEGRATSPCILLANLTGGVGTSRSLHAPGFDAEDWWQQLLDLYHDGAILVATTRPATAMPQLWKAADGRADYVSAFEMRSELCQAGSPFSSAAPFGHRLGVSKDYLSAAHGHGDGIDPLQVYAICSVHDADGNRLIQLWNPWALRRWQGEWSVWSKSWVQNRALERLVKAHDGPKHSFFMSYSDFHAHFEAVHFCRVFTAHFERTVCGEWSPQTAGGPSFEQQWWMNPRIRMETSLQCTVFINLSLPDSRFTRNAGDAMALHVVHSKVYPLLYHKRDIVARSTYVLGDSISLESVFFATNEMWIVPSTYQEGTLGPFIIRAFCAAAFDICAVPLHMHWHPRSLQAVVESSGELQNGEKNYQFALTLPPALTHSVGVTRSTLHEGSITAPVASPSSLHRGDDGGVSQENGEPRLEEGQVALTVVPVTMRMTVQAASAELSVALFVVRSQKLMRTLGPIRSEDVFAKSSFVRGTEATVEVGIPLEGTAVEYNVIACVQPPGSSATLDFTVWCSMPQVTLTPLPLWVQKAIRTSWATWSGSYHDARNNPQIHLLTSGAPNRTYAISMRVSNVNCPDPAVVFFVLSAFSDGSKMLRGRIPPHRIVALSEYVRQTSVLVALHSGPSPPESYIIIPCLLPSGSTGDCEIVVHCIDDDFTLHDLGTVYTQ